MKFYIYDDSNEVVAITIGTSNSECEDKASMYIGGDEYGGTYTPAFGTADGLIENPDAEIL